MIRKIVAYLFLLLSIVLSSSVLYAQHMAYSVDLRETQATGLIPVIAHVTGIHDSTAVFQMSIWSPGSYGLWQGKNYVEQFKAADSTGQALSVDQSGLFQWTVSDPLKLATISYTINTRVLAASDELNVAAHVDSNGLLANGTVLFGWLANHKNISSSVNVLFPDTCELATNLDPAADQLQVKPENKYRQTIFAAQDFAQLADAVILTSPDLNVSEFNISGARYIVAISSDDEALLDSIVQSTKAIARTTQRFFSRTPFTSYFAFYHVAPGLTTTNVLPHANASAYLIEDGEWAEVRRSLLPNLARSLFAAWDGYEIKSYLLAPPDYRDTIRATSLWFVNGTQRYYAAMMLTRAGLMRSEDFNGMLENWVARMYANEPQDSTSLEQLANSIGQLSARERNYFESRSTLTALAMDLEIRSQTDDESSLDQVMIILDAKAHHGKTIIDRSLTDSLSLAAGVDLKAFRARYVAGHDPLPLDSYVKLMGLLMQPATQARSVNFRVSDGSTSTQRLRRIAMLAPRKNATFR